jgi:hypothetical protein
MIIILYIYINRLQEPIVLYNYKAINAVPNLLGQIPLII